MPNAIKWESAPTDRSNVLSSELDNLADNARSAAGTAIDNSSNLDQFAWLELVVDFVSAPSSGAFVEIYMVTAPDGTNYADGSDTVDPGLATWVLNIPVRASTAAQRLTHREKFELPPMKCKFLLTNKTGQPFPASGSTLKLFTANDEVQ